MKGDFMGYCRWYEKYLEDVPEHKRKLCEGCGMYCTDCPLVTEKDDASFILPDLIPVPGASF